MFSFKDYLESADCIKSKLGAFSPEFLMVLGSGLGFLADEVEEPVFIDYKDIPHFRSSTAPGHMGRFVCGRLGGKQVIIMQGRMHIYEGYSPEDAAYPVRVAKLLGATSMIVTNAAGGINLDYKVGELVALNDFIQFGLPNPLIGQNIKEFGPRFCDMTKVFDRDYLKLVKEIAEEHNIVLQEGVYVYATGPQYETPAEIRAYRSLGADVVGMSTVPECIAANHTGMRILGVSLVTNMAAGVLDQPLSEEEVLEQANAAKDYFAKLLITFLQRS